VAIVTVTYKGRTLEIPYRPEHTVQRLTAEAIRAHGLRFAANAHLRLHTAAGRQLKHEITAKRARIQPGAALALQTPELPKEEG